MKLTKAIKNTSNLLNEDVELKDLYENTYPTVIELSKNLKTLYDEQVDKSIIKKLEKYTNYKIQLPALYFDNRQTTLYSATEYSNIFQVDIDGITNEKDVIDLYELLTEFEYTRFLFISPSFTGVKLFVEVKIDIEDVITIQTVKKEEIVETDEIIFSPNIYKKNINEAVGNDILELFLENKNLSYAELVKQDEGITAKSACFICKHQKDENDYYMFYNPNSSIFEINAEKYKNLKDKKQNPSNSTPKKTIEIDINGINDFEDIKEKFKDYKFNKGSMYHLFYNCLNKYIIEKNIVLTQHTTFDSNSNFKAYHFLNLMLIPAAAQTNMSYVELYDFVYNLNYIEYDTGSAKIYINFDREYMFKDNRWFNEYLKNYIKNYNPKGKYAIRYDKLEEFEAFENILELQTDYLTGDCNDKNKIDDFIINSYSINKTPKIISSPGTGKTRYILNRAIENHSKGIKTLIITPLVLIVNQNYIDLSKMSNDLNIFEGFNKSTPDNSYDVFIITPDNYSLNQKFFNKLKDVEVIVDEWHNFILTQNYTDKYNSLYNDLRLYERKIFFSATNPIVYYSKKRFDFNDLKIVNKKMDKTYTRIIVKNRDYTRLMYNIFEEHKEDYQIVYVFNTKQSNKIEKLKTKFNFLNDFDFIHAGSKEDEIFLDIKNDEKCFKNICITKVLSEGVNIKLSKDKILFVFFNNQTIFDIEQYTDRFRNKEVKILDIFQYDNQTDFDTESFKDDFLPYENYLDYEELSKSFSRNIILIKEYYESIVDIYTVNNLHKSYVIKNEDELFQNDLGLDYLLNQAFLKHLNYSKKLKDYFDDRSIIIQDDIIFNQDLQRNKLEEKIVELSKDEKYKYNDKEYTIEELKELKDEIISKLNSIKKDLTDEIKQRQRLTQRTKLRGNRNEIGKLLKDIEKNNIDKVKNNVNELNNFIEFENKKKDHLEKLKKLNEEYKILIENKINKLIKDLYFELWSRSNTSNDLSNSNNEIDENALYDILNINLFFEKEIKNLVYGEKITKENAKMIEELKKTDTNFNDDDFKDIPKCEKFFTDIINVYQLFKNFFGNYVKFYKNGILELTPTSILVEGNLIVKSIEFLKSLILKDVSSIFSDKNKQFIIIYLVYVLELIDNDKTDNKVYELIKNKIDNNNETYFIEKNVYKDALILKDNVKYTDDNLITIEDIIEKYVISIKDKKDLKKLKYKIEAFLEIIFFDSKDKSNKMRIRIDLDNKKREITIKKLKKL